MQLYFSNRRFWGILCIFSAVLAFMLFTLAAALLPVWPAALLAFICVLGLVYLGFRFFSLPEKIFIEVWDGKLKINRALTNGHDLVVIKDIKHMQHLGHQLRFIMSDVTVFTLSLNYLNPEDIKRLFIFLKFVPSAARKMI